MVGADQVLAVARVDGLLEVDGGVHLAHAGGGHVHQADATVESGRDHAAHVVDHAAAQTEDERLLVDAAAQDLVHQTRELRHALGVLAGGHHQLVHLVAAQLQSAQHLFAVEAIHHIVGNQVVVARLAALRENAIVVQVVQKAALHDHIGAHELLARKVLHTERADLGSAANAVLVCQAQLSVGRCCRCRVGCVLARDLHLGEHGIDARRLRVRRVHIHAKVLVNCSSGHVGDKER
mmetsp:Transcript_38590/g.97153  ORF Transcript_38590/g.97153 Transcript_38590/m.97153 type:complete len:236 (+) Transcript_38590:2533-3240(+)